MARSASRFLAWFLAVGVLSPLSSGCATAGDGMQEKLYDATRGYNRALRWSDFDRAAAYVPPESEDAFLDDHERVDEELVVLDYRLTRLKLEKQMGIASCRVEIQWHTDRNLVVRDTEVEQVWQWHNGNWVLVDEFRVKGEPLTIFAEKGDEGTLEHPYLPGLEDYRKTRDIGLSETDKRKRDRARRKAGNGRGSMPTDAERAAMDEKHQLPTMQHRTDM